MFTGLIEAVGTVKSLRSLDGGAQLEVTARELAADVRTGDSIAVNGCCLTVAGHNAGELTFDLLAETLDRTNLRALSDGSRANLERALAANARLGGHFVQGHVDCATQIISFQQSGADHRLEIELPAEFARYLAFKGSVAVNGISLTVAEVLPQSFAVWIIPHTKRQTNLDTARAGDLVNLEFDLLAKYVERMLGCHAAGD